MDKIITHNQQVAILIDGNNIERSIYKTYGESKMLNYLSFVPYILRGRALTFFDYFIEGIEDGTKTKFKEEINKHFFGNLHRCHKSADVPLSMHAVKIMNKVNTIIILSGDADYCDTVDFLRNNGVRVEIACIYGTGSKVLIEKANTCVYIQERDTYQLEKFKTSTFTKEMIEDANAVREQINNIETLIK